MKVLQCDFLTAASDPEGFPPANLPEVVFMGRSNVGKSSLINALLGKKDLARTSSDPGRTRQVIFFRINGACLFVDLPGYGFARVSKAVRAQWRSLVEAYLSRPAPGKLAILLVDARHARLPLDLTMRAWLEDRGMPYRVVATKSDKLSRAALARNLKEHLKQWSRPDLLIPCSALTREGMPQIWAAIDGMLNEAKS